MKVTQRQLYNFNIAMEAVRGNGLRSFLTALGIIFGVAAVICMMAIGNGARKEVLELIEMVGANNIIILPIEREVNTEEGKGETKFSPGLRLLDKWAVQLGGGRNHRFGLFDMVLIKENHIAAAGTITDAVNKVRANDPRQRPIEVEVKNLLELEESLALNIDRILLDNMSLDEMRRAVQVTGGRVPLEASGNMSLERVAAVAATGVDFISIGMLTHSVQALDISLLLDNQN